MLPAPTTIATSTPRARTAAIWRASRWTSPASVPWSRSPISASPESFRRTRLNLGSASATYAEVREPGDPDVLAGLRGHLLSQLLDRLRVVLFGVDVRLVEERDFLPPLRELTFDDFRDHVVRFAVLARLLLEDPTLGLALLLGDFLGGDVLRGGCCDVQRDLVGECPEVLVAGDEVGLALDFDHRPHLVVGMDVGGDDALVGAAPFALGGRGLALDPEDLDRALGVALRLGERRFAVHHRRARPVPKRFHVSRG